MLWLQGAAFYRVVFFLSYFTLYNDGSYVMKNMCRSNKRASVPAVQMTQYVDIKCLEVRENL